MLSTVVAVNCRSVGRAAADVGWPVALLEVLTGLGGLAVLAVLAVLVVAVKVPPALVVLLGSAPGVDAGGPVAVQAAASRVAVATCSTARGVD